MVSLVEIFFTEEGYFCIICLAYLNKTSVENQNQKNEKYYGETKRRSLFTQIRIFDYKM